MPFNNDGDQTDTRIEQILKALEDGNSESLETMFSIQALSETKDFSGQVDALFGFFQGKVLSWKRTGLTSSESVDGREKSCKNILWYEVITDKEEFIFFMIDCCIDTKDSDNVGLYTLRIIKKEDEEEQLTYWQDMEIAGIFIPEDKGTVSVNPK